MEVSSLSPVSSSPSQVADSPVVVSDGSISSNASKSLSFGMRMFHNIAALFIGGLIAVLVVAMSQMWGLFTADLMNQYGQVVDSFSGSEILYDITTGGTVTIKTTKAYQWVQDMTFTIYYNQDKLTIDKDSFESAFPLKKVQATPYTLVANVDFDAKDIAKDTAIVTFTYTGKNAWRVQTNTVFMAKVNMGSGNEDLVVFTNTPTNPEPIDNYRE